MRIFDEPSFTNSGKNSQCPVCGTSEKKPVALIPLSGTQVGFTSEAVQIHIDCVDLLYCVDHGFLFQYCARGER